MHWISAHEHLNWMARPSLPKRPRCPSSMAQKITPVG
nr:MAG TPA: hypothetical protein [Caudoviricetes sp.]